MAPMPPLGRAGLLAMLRREDLPSLLPLLFGSPHPHVGVVYEEGVYRLRTLVVDQEALRAFSLQRMASGKSFQPEHVVDFSHPSGEIHAEGKDLAAFCAAIERMNWPPDW